MTFSNDPKMKASIKENIQTNYAKAEVYYQTLNVQNIKETEKYSVSMRQRIKP